VQARLQQTPAAQNPLLHSLPCEQDMPRAFPVEQPVAAELQAPDAQFV
jgi:hypothetical protein